MTGICAHRLLDEVAAHFDPRRRAALYQRLNELGAQVWMTGADRTLSQKCRRVPIFCT